MPIDRKRYEPITGNPRRRTKKEEEANTDVGDTGGRNEESLGPSGPSGAHAGTRGDQEGPKGDPQGTEGSTADPGAHRASQGRTRRVKVTPRDWAELEAMADRLGGLPYAKVYNVAFEALRGKMGSDEA